MHGPDQHHQINFLCNNYTKKINTLVFTSVPGCKCSDDLIVIAVSAVSLLLIVTLTTVILTQYLLIIRMRRSSRDNTDTYAEVTNPTTKTTDVPVSPNEAYALHKITYEMVKRPAIARQPLY